MRGHPWGSGSRAVSAHADEITGRVRALRDEVARLEARLDEAVAGRDQLQRAAARALYELDDLHPDRAWGILAAALGRGDQPGPWSG